MFENPDDANDASDDTGDGDGLKASAGSTGAAIAATAGAEEAAVAALVVAVRLDNAPADVEIGSILNDLVVLKCLILL